jgi:hypothetical protein
MRRLVTAVALAAILWGCSGGGGEPSREAPSSGAGDGAFTVLEAELLAPKCSRSGCHGGETPAAGLNLSKGAAYDALVGVSAQRRPDRLLVNPGDPEGSYLVQRLVPEGDTPHMPLGGSPLPDAEVERVRAWIRDGAKR